MAKKRSDASDGLTVQALMRKAIERRDELNVFIGVLQAMIAEEAQHVNGNPKFPTSGN